MCGFVSGVTRGGRGGRLAHPWKILGRNFEGEREKKGGKEKGGKRKEKRRGKGRREKRKGKEKREGKEKTVY